MFIAVKPLLEKFNFAENYLVRLHQSVGDIRIDFPADLADLAVWSSGDPYQNTGYDTLKSDGGYRRACTRRRSQYTINPIG